MKHVFNILPLAALVLIGGCSSKASVGNYLWGDSDTTTPAPAQSATTQAGLPRSQSVSAFQYQPTTSPVEPHANFSKIPKNSQRVYVVVNDHPITGRDIAQRMRLNRVLGRGGASTRKGAVRELIDDVIQIDEAKRNKVSIDDRRIDGAIKGMTGSASGAANLKARLRKQGISWSALREQVKASLALRWLMQKQGAKVGKVDEAEVDRRLAKINSDPRRQAVTVYTLRQVTLPVERTSPAMASQLLQARAIEAQQIARRYRGCSSLRKASSGIYNVKLSRTIQADGRKLPPQMKKALRTAGRKKLIGPMRVRQGIQMIAYCGTKRINPPKVSRNQVKALVQNEKFGNAADRVLRDLRRKAFIDYKVASARP